MLDPRPGADARVVAELGPRTVLAELAARARERGDVDQVRVLEEGAAKMPSGSDRER